MLTKRKYMISVTIIFIILLILFTGCSRTKKVRDGEVAEFKESILAKNEKIKELEFTFRRPSLIGDLAYDGDLGEEDFEFIIDEFKNLIDIEFMQRMGDEYWGGSRPHDFVLYIYIDEIREEGYDYEIISSYNKTFVHDEEPDNIDGYETWHIGDN